jgi:sirohydrochlorin ferrochelatase
MICVPLRSVRSFITLTTLLAISIITQSVPGAIAGLSTRPDRAPETGILLLAHGGKPNWNEEVNKLAARVNKTVPVEVAFGMASRRNMQDAINRLTARGVREIVAVPLFISSHSSVITATQYLLGLRATAPPELAIYARMSHSHSGGSDNDHHHHSASTEDQTAPVKSAVPIRWSPALDRHPIVAEILRARSLALSREPSNEVVIVVAHGPVSNEDNVKWLADMAALVEQMRGKSQFKRVEYLTVRDDAPQSVREQATAELRRTVERAAGSRVLIVPLLLSYGGIEEGIKKRLEGLDYTMSAKALLPDERLDRWVLLSVEK